MQYYSQFVYEIEKSIATNLALKMLFSILQVESSVDTPSNYPDNYTPIPQENDIEQNSFKTNQSDPLCGTAWRITRSTVGLLAFFMLCIMIPIAHYYSHPPCSSNPSPPRFFLNSLSVSTFNILQGELSTTLNANITISNGINSTNTNILNVHAIIVYNKDKAIVQNSPIIVNQENVDDSRGSFFVVYKNENKTLHLTFNTTGWERDQPIVDDDVIQEIIEKRRHKWVVSFGLKMLVEAEVNYNSVNIPIVMQPYCLDLEVDLAPLERGETAKLNDVVEARECLGIVEWYMNKYR